MKTLTAKQTAKLAKAHSLVLKAMKLLEEVESQNSELYHTRNGRLSFKAEMLSDNISSEAFGLGGII